MPKKTLIIFTLFSITIFGVMFFVDEAKATTTTTATSTITVVSPNGGEEWERDSQHSISWSWQGDIEEVNITLNKDDQYVKDLFTNLENTSSTSWTLSSDLATSSDYKIKITSATSTDIYDESDDYFSIIEPPSVATSSITVASPNGGEEWKIGTQYSITWDSVGDIDKVTITLRKDDQHLKNLFSDLENDGSVNWTLGSDLATSSDYKIRIVNATSTDVYDESDDYFSVVESTTTTECLPDGTLIKLPGDPKVYVIIDCQKKWIKTVKAFKRGGYRWVDIQEVSSPVIQAYANYLETTTLLRPFGHHRVYRIVNGKRLWIPAIAAFNAQGLKWEDIEDVDESEVNQYSQINLVKLPDNPKVYYLTNNGFKKHIPSIEVFDSYGNNWEDVVEVSIDELNGYPDVVLIRYEDDYRVYKLENERKRWIKNIQTFNRLGFNWDNVVIVNVTEINAYSAGDEIE